ncbi:MAG: FHA domain-containing protein [Phototrophicaceae bacterium]
MQGSDSFRLIVRRGPQPNQTFDLNKDIVTIGRDITNDIVINDPEVSRHHLRYTRGAGGYTIEDLGSTNGTFINGQRLTGAKPLNNGDMIGLGETVTLGYEVSRARRDAAPEEGGAMGVTVPGAAPQAYSPQPAYNAPQSNYAPAPEYSAYAAPEPASPYAEPAYASAPPQAPPTPGAYYDEAEEEGGGNNTFRFILIGCAILLVFCCCATVAAGFIIDANCLWDQIPVVSDVLEAVGFSIDPNSAACT